MARFLTTTGVSYELEELLVGSLPYDDEASAMARAYELAGDRLIALPDGGIGERSQQCPNGNRSQWVAGLAYRLSDEPSLFEVLDHGTMNEHGFPADFDSTVRLRPKLSPDELGERLHLGYDTFARRRWTHFQHLRASAGRPELRMPLPRAIDAARGAPVDIAYACGLGRRGAETADELIRRCVHLASVEP